MLMRNIYIYFLDRFTAFQGTCLDFYCIFSRKIAQLKRSVLLDFQRYGPDPDLSFLGGHIRFRSIPTPTFEKKKNPDQDPTFEKKTDPDPTYFLPNKLLFFFRHECQ